MAGGTGGGRLARAGKEGDKTGEGNAVNTKNRICVLRRLSYLANICVSRRTFHTIHSGYMFPCPSESHISTYRSRGSQKKGAGIERLELSTFCL